MEILIFFLFIAVVTVYIYLHKQFDNNGDIPEDTKKYMAMVLGLILTTSLILNLYIFIDNRNSVAALEKSHEYFVAEISETLKTFNLEIENLLSSWDLMSHEDRLAIVEGLFNQTLSETFLQIDSIGDGFSEMQNNEYYNYSLFYYAGLSRTARNFFGGILNGLEDDIHSIYKDENHIREQLGFFIDDSNMILRTFSAIEESIIENNLRGKDRINQWVKGLSDQRLYLYDNGRSYFLTEWVVW